MGILKAKITQQLKKLKLHLVIPSAMMVVLSCFSTVSANFQEVGFTIIITPDNMPIIFPKQDANGNLVDYGFSEDLSSLELLETEICQASDNCSSEALSAGAVYYKVRSIGSVGDVIFYYNELGTLLGTQEASQIIGFDDGSVDIIENSTESYSSSSIEDHTSELGVLSTETDAFTESDFILSSSASQNAFGNSFQGLQYHIIITSDYTPIIWPKRNAQGNLFDLGGVEKLSTAQIQNASICSSSNCSPSAINAGAVYYTEATVAGIGNVIYYYNENGELVGTEEASQIKYFNSTDVATAQSNISNSNKIDDFIASYDHTNYMVGSTKAEFNVTPSGAANYSIPLNLPSSANGFIPQLSINYSSNSSNGLMGVGFSLGGLSTISRCRKTKEQDGLSYNSKAVNYDNNDAYCINGKRLLLVSGTHNQTGAVYRTEIDEFSKITIETASNGGAATFKVMKKSGETYFYENGINLNGTTDTTKYQAWPVTKIINLSGQSINFSYTEKTGSTTGFIPSTIIYGSGNQLSKVAFIYEDRDDNFLGYNNGFAFSRDKRLKKIITSHANNNLRQYELIYSSVNNLRSKVSSIQECAVPSYGSSSFSQCMTPITFDWNNKQFNSTFSSLPHTGISTGVHSSSDPAKTDISRVKTGDFNGDGLTDVYTVNGWGASNSDTVFFANTNGTFNKVTTNIGSYVHNNNVAARIDISRFKTGDFNGDGKTDLYEVTGYGNNYPADRIYLSNGNGTFEVKTTNIYTKVDDSHAYAPTGIARIKLGDFNGDGLTDVYKVNGWGGNAADTIFTSKGDGTFDSYNTNFTTYVSAETSSVSDMSRIKLADFNNDGKTDIYYVDNQGVADTADKIYLTNMNSDGNFKEINGIAGHPSYKVNSIKFGDFNGDGLLDIYKINESSFGHGSNQDIIHISKGDGTYITENGLNFGKIGSSVSLWLQRFTLSDFNRDGKADIYYIANYGNTTKDQIHYRTNNNFLKQDLPYYRPISSARESNDLARVRFGDFNGDGYLDNYRVEGYGNSTADTIYTNSNQTDKIASIKNAFQTVNINYELASAETDIYSKGSNVFTANERTLTPKSYLVSSTQQSNGLGGTNTTSYRYTDLRLNRNGRGVTGFKTFEKTDHTQKTRSTYHYLRSHPFKGKLESMSKVVFDAVNTDKTLVNPITLKTISKSYREINHPLNPKVKGVYNHDTTETDHLLNVNTRTLSGFNGNTQEVDQYGNIKWSKIITTGHGQTSTKTITNNYFPANESDWFISQLENTSVKHEFSGTSAHSDTSSITKDASFTYDTNGRISTETTAPNSSDLTQRLINTYEYDDLGLKSKVIQQGWHSNGTTPITRWTRFTNKQENINGEASLKTISTNSNGESSTEWVSLNHGGTLLTKDANQKVTHAEYDAAGRLVKETNHLGIASFINYQWTPNEVIAKYKVTQYTQGMFDHQSVYFDSQGRKVKEETKALDGRDVINETLYNAKGQVDQINRPYLAHTEAVWICFTYDKYGRKTQTNSPGAMNGSAQCEGGNRAMTSVSYNGLQKTTTDALNHVKREQSNLLGALVSVEEALYTADYSTINYTYDDLGNLKSVLDPEGKTTELSYDNNSRKITLEDPAMGKWTYQYNSFGELEKQTDAKGQIVNIDYDSLGRMYQRTDVEGTWNWNYAGLNETTPVGQLKSVTGPNSYQKTMQYNSNLQLTYSTQRQKLPNNSLQSLSQAYTYDAYGRVATNTKIDGQTSTANQAIFSIENEYNRYGHLVAVKSPNQTISSEAQAQLTAQQQIAQQKADNANALANSYLSQATNYQQQALHYANSSSAGLLTAANDLRQIAIALINKAQTKREEAQNYTQQAQNGSGDISSAHKIMAKSRATDAIQQLKQAKSYLLAYKNNLSTLGGVYTFSHELLTLADNNLNGAQASYTQFQNQLALAERYQNFSDGLTADLADSEATTWWRASEADAEGRVTQSIFGNGTITNRTYDPKTGQLHKIVTNDGVNTLQNLSYEYDNLNNVTQRSDNVLNYYDTYNYDHLERLTNSTVNIASLGSSTKTWSFDKVGNIKTIDDDTFEYDLADKLTAAKGNIYKYDDNGNQKESAGKIIRWSSFNKPVSLSRGTQQTEFVYDADHSRMLKVNKDSQMWTKATQYFGDYEKVTEVNGDVEHRYHIMVGSSAVALKSVKVDSSGLPLQAPVVNYLHKDALGSVDVITDINGSVVERLGFTPFGSRRDLSALQAILNGDSLTLPNFPAVSNRGFTGHEHIDELDLIHMNGRVYDPEVGRFLSADPFVQAPDRTQSFNRYAYVMNNPLRYTDPSGFHWSDQGVGHSSYDSNNVDSDPLDSSSDSDIEPESPSDDILGIGDFEWEGNGTNSPEAGDQFDGEEVSLADLYSDTPSKDNKNTIRNRIITRYDIGKRTNKESNKFTLLSTNQSMIVSVGILDFLFNKNINRAQEIVSVLKVEKLSDKAVGMIKGNVAGKIQNSIVDLKFSYETRTYSVKEHREALVHMSEINETTLEERYIGTSSIEGFFEADFKYIETKTIYHGYETIFY